MSEGRVFGSVYWIAPGDMAYAVNPPMFAYDRRSMGDTHVSMLGGVLSHVSAQRGENIGIGSRKGTKA